MSTVRTSRDDPNLKGARESGLVLIEPHALQTSPRLSEAKPGTEIGHRDIPEVLNLLDGSVENFDPHLLCAIIACRGRSPFFTMLFPHMARSRSWQTGCLCTALLAVIWVRILCWVVLL